MGTARSTRRGRIAASLLAATALVVTGCAGGGGTPESTATEEASENNPVTLSVATSQPEETPNYYCGVQLLKDRLEEADIGFTVDLFPASQLGPDAADGRHLHGRGRRGSGLDVLANPPGQFVLVRL